MLTKILGVAPVKKIAVKGIISIIALIAISSSLYFNINFGWSVGGIVFVILLCTEPTKWIAIPMIAEGFCNRRPLVIIPMFALLIVSIIASLICTFGYSMTFIQTSRQVANNSDVSIQAAHARVEAAKAELKAVEGYANIKPDELKQGMHAMKERVREWWAKTDSGTGLKYSEIMDENCSPKYSSRYGGPMTSAAQRLCSDYKRLTGKNDFMGAQTQIYNHQAYLNAMNELKDAMTALSEATEKVALQGGSTVSTFDMAMQKGAIFISVIVSLIIGIFGYLPKVFTIKDMENVVIIGSAITLESICVLFPYYTTLSKLKSKVEVPKMSEWLNNPFRKDEVTAPTDKTRQVNVADIPTDKKHPLSFHLGRCEQGVEIYPNILKFPHAIIAGTTGTGKTRLVYHMLCSIMEKTTPEKFKLVGIDMKRGRELAAFIDSPFLAMPVATDGQSAVKLLAWVKGEMERRYTAITPYPHVEDIDEYNGIKGVEKLPYIIVLIDETGELFASKEACTSIFSDKDTTVGKESVAIIETLVRLARAAGIHCILCTQRPDVTSVPGQVKSNCGARIALSLPLQQDSMTVLGKSGAEYLPIRHCIFSHGLLTATTKLCDMSKEKLLKSTEKLKQKYGTANFLQQVSGEFTTNDSPKPKARRTRKEDVILDKRVVNSNESASTNIVPFRTPIAALEGEEIIDVTPEVQSYNANFTSTTYVVNAAVDTALGTDIDVKIENSESGIIKSKSKQKRVVKKVKQFDLVKEAYEKGFTTVSEIARETGVDKGNVSRYLSRLTK